MWEFFSICSRRMADIVIPIPISSSWIISIIKIIRIELTKYLHTSKHGCHEFWIWKMTSSPFSDEFDSVMTSHSVDSFDEFIEV